MPGIADIFRTLLSAGANAPPRYEARPQPVRTAGGAVRSSLGAPVTSRFGPAAPVESRNLADLVRVATMPQQQDITGVPLNDAPVVKPFAEPAITGMPLDEGVTVKPFMEPAINPVPLGEASRLPWQQNDLVLRGPKPDISQWLASQLRGH